jgi:hypothetical protein
LTLTEAVGELRGVFHNSRATTLREAAAWAPMTEQIRRLYHFRWGKNVAGFGPGKYSDRYTPGPTFNLAKSNWSLPPELAATVMGQTAQMAWAAGYDASGYYWDRRALTLACQIWGLPWSCIEKALDDTRNYGLKRASEAWAPIMRPDKAWKAVGSVYLAWDNTGLAKIGFSRKPAKRVRDLRSGLVLAAAAPGTLLHEWAIHSILLKYQVRPEWYRADDIPPWLFTDLPSEERGGNAGTGSDGPVESVPASEHDPSGHATLPDGASPPLATGDSSAELSPDYSDAGPLPECLRRVA